MEILSIFGILASINATIITFIGSVLLAFHINDENNLESIRKDTQDNLNHFINKTSYKKYYGIDLIYDKKENNIESLKYHIENAINDSQRYSNSVLIKINRQNSLQKK